MLVFSSLTRKKFSGRTNEGDPDLQGVASEGSLLVGLNEGLGNKATIRLWVDSRPACRPAGNFCHVLKTTS